MSGPRLMPKLLHQETCIECAAGVPCQTLDRLQDVQALAWADEIRDAAERVKRERSKEDLAAAIARRRNAITEPERDRAGKE